MAVTGSRVGYVRWVVCALLFFAATINYIDRQVIGMLKRTLQQEFGWTEIDYADIVFAFQLAYAIGLAIAGRLVDKLGTTLGFAIAHRRLEHRRRGPRRGPGRRAVCGSRPRLVRPRLHAPAWPASCSMRFLLGLGEAGNFPAAIKTVAEWFPKKERAFATGIFNSGTNIGAVVTPAIVPLIAASYGWYWAFVATGLSASSGSPSG